MRNKILVPVLTFFILISFAGTAAAIDVKFHGNMWQTIGTTDYASTLQGKLKSGKTDFFSYNNMLNTEGYSNGYDFLDAKENVSTFFGLTKARLRCEATTDDGLAKFVYGLEVGTFNWGDKDDEDGFGLSGDGVNQETRFAYLQLAIPGLGDNQLVRAGLQPTKINQWVWSETAAGLTWHGKHEEAKWMLGWYRGDEDRAGNSSDDDYYVAKIEGNVLPDLTLGLFAIWAELGSNDITGADWTDVVEYREYDAQYYYIGTTSNFDNGMLFGGYDFIYQGGDIEFKDNATLAEVKDLDRKAWLGDLTLGYKFNNNFKLYGNILYVSGDDDPNDNNAENFDSIDVDVKVGIIFFKDSLLADCDRYISDAPYLQDKGLINYALTGEYQIDKNHHLRGAVRYLQTAEDMKRFDKKEKDLGTEFDIWYTYKYNKYVKLKVEGAYLVADKGADLLAASSDGGDVFKLAAGVQFKF
jgi:predicted porin